MMWLNKTLCWMVLANIFGYCSWNIVLPVFCFVGFFPEMLELKAAGDGMPLLFHLMVWQEGNSVAIFMCNQLLHSFTLNLSLHFLQQTSSSNTANYSFYNFYHLVKLSYRFFFLACLINGCYMVSVLRQTCDNLWEGKGFEQYKCQRENTCLDTILEKIRGFWLYQLLNKDSSGSHGLIHLL